MIWNKLKRLLNPPDIEKESDESQLPDIDWLDPKDNHWGVPTLDVRPVTQTLVSTSENPECAANLTSFGQEDGTSFINILPPVNRTVHTDLLYRTDGRLVDGALFAPLEMEHKWALFYHQRRIIFIRSWTRQVRVVATVEQHRSHIKITSVQGMFLSDDEAASFTVRVLDYLMLSHALDVVIPAPLPSGLERNPRKAAMWCFANFGERVLYATTHEFNTAPPDQLLRTASLLHIASARGDIETVRTLLEDGIAIDLRSRNGLSPLHWSIYRDDTTMIDFLLECGSPVDIQTDEGHTPLMNIASSSGSTEKAILLLDHGADPNAVDNHGYTALHRAAETGYKDLVELLLNRGAVPNPEAEGRTPRSLAEERGEMAIVELLDSRSSDG